MSKPLLFIAGISKGTINNLHGMINKNVYVIERAYWSCLTNNKELFDEFTNECNLRNMNVILVANRKEYYDKIKELER